MSVQALQQINAALMQTLHFSPDDLAANRQGKLTPAQQDRLKVLVGQGMRSGMRIAGMVIVIVVVACMLIALGSQGIIQLPLEAEGLGENAPLVLGVMGVIMIFYVLMLIYSMNKSRGMASGKAKVKALTGKVKVSGLRARYAPGVSYIIQIGRDKLYTTDPAVEQAFENGILYRVYVIGSKASSIMVSAEALGAG